MTTDAALIRLMTWLSPSFPVGSFSYSHGIESAVEHGIVRSADELERWITGIVGFGAGRIDADLLRRAWTAVTDKDAAALADAADLCRASRGTREIALESSAQGAAFMTAVRAVWPHPLLDGLDPGGHAVAVGATAAAWGIALRPTLTAYLHALAANMVSAGVRLIPLGQTQGQTVLAALEEPVLTAVEAALTRPVEDFGAATAMVDWTSMTHETQYTRLFRS